MDYQATKNVLDCARAAGASHFVLLSAICVQKPLLEFQKAKLKLEAELQVSTTNYLIAVDAATLVQLHVTKQGLVALA